MKLTKKNKLIIKLFILFYGGGKLNTGQKKRTITIKQDNGGKGVIYFA